MAMLDEMGWERSLALPPTRPIVPLIWNKVMWQYYWQGYVPLVQQLTDTHVSKPIHPYCQLDKDQEVRSYMTSGPEQL